MRMTSDATLAVLGSGSWGTALAMLAGTAADEPVALVCRRAEVAAELARTRENAAYLPGIRLPDPVRPLGPETALGGVEEVLFVMPSTGFRAAAAAWVGRLPEAATLVSCTKGIEPASGLTMSGILRELFPRNRVAVLSGPNHAEEVSRQLATATVIGCADEARAEKLQHRLSTPWFRAYRATDVLGIELGGALKNVFALAAGMADGLGLGDNAKAALVTRSLVEMQRLGVALGGRAETFIGLSGMGDLVTTAYSEHSRNNRTGRALGRGMSLEEAIDSLHGMVAEGVPNTRSAFELVERTGVDSPIIREVHAVLEQGKGVREAVHDLLTRDLRAE